MCQIQFKKQTIEAIIVSFDINSIIPLMEFFSFWFFFYVLRLFCLLCFSKLNVWDGVFCCRFVFSVFLVFSTFLVSSIVFEFLVLFVCFSLLFPEQSQSCSHFDLGGPFLAWHFARQGQFQPVRSASSEKNEKCLVFDHVMLMAGVKVIGLRATALIYWIRIKYFQ